MAGKRKVNQAIIMDPEKTQYQGFVEDIVELVDVLKELDLENKIDGVLDQVKNMRDQIEVPDIIENNEDVRDNEAAAKKKSLSDLVKQLEEMKTYAHDIIEWTTGDRTAMHALIHWKNDSNPDSDIEKMLKEDNYHHNIVALMEYATNTLAVFCGGKHNGFPQNIKRHLDTFNTLDQYREFTTENSVTARVDQILTDMSKLYTRSARIVSKATRHRTEKNLEKNLDYETQNLEAFGKVCNAMPDYSFDNLKETFNQAYAKSNTDTKAEQDAIKVFQNAEKKLDELKKLRAELIKRGKTEAEKRRQAEIAYNNTLEIVTKVKAFKETLEKDTFTKKVPTLDDLDAASKKKYKSYRELLEDCRRDMDKLALAETDEKSKQKSKNEEIEYAVKNSADTRLKDFVDAEGTRYKYLNFPRFARAIREKMQALPKSIYINCERFNIQQINAEIDRMIKEKKGENTMWFALKGMLEMANDFCPNEFLTKPLTEKVIQECEENGKAYADKLDNDELHQKLKTYSKVKDEVLTLEEEIREMESHKKNEKAYWTKENKTLLKNKKAQLKQKNEEFEAIKADKIYVEGASTVSKMMKESAGFGVSAFRFRDLQVDLYYDVLNNAVNNISEHKQNEKRAMQSVYAEMVVIYESIPEEAIRKSGVKGSTKKDSNLKEMLDKMKNAGSVEEFEDAYEGFNIIMANLKESYSEKEIQKIEKILKDREKEMKDCDYETRIKEYNDKIEKAETEYGNAKSDYETKARTAATSRRNYDIAKQNLVAIDKYYDRKEAAEKYDSNNTELASAKYDIDKTGDRFFRMIRQPFNQYYVRKDYAKKKKHGDSKEFTNMIARLTDVVDLDDNASIAQYKNALTNLKTFAQTYVTVREGQFFISKTNPMRKYRLSYAKGLIALCEDQLKTLDGTERTVKLNPAVDKYLSRTKKVAVKQLKKEERDAAKKAYEQSLDAKKKEAVKAYKNSAEYRARKAYEDSKVAEEITKVGDDIENKKNAIVMFEKSAALSGSIPDLEREIEVLEKRHDELVRNYQIKKLQGIIDSGALSPQEKTEMETFLQDMINNKLNVGKKKPRKKINNIRNVKEEDQKIIIEPEDEKEIEGKKQPSKRKSMKELREEEKRRLLIDDQLDEINRINDRGPGKKKSPKKNNNIIIEEEPQDPNTSFDSVADIERQMEEALNPVHFENAKKNKMMNEDND